MHFSPFLRIGFLVVAPVFVGGIFLDLLWFLVYLCLFGLFWINFILSVIFYIRFGGAWHFCWGVELLVLIIFRIVLIILSIILLGFIIYRRWLLYGSSIVKFLVDLGNLVFDFDTNAFNELVWANSQAWFDFTEVRIFCLEVFNEGINLWCGFLESFTCIR